MELKPKPPMNEVASPETLSPHFLLTLGQAGKIRNTPTFSHPFIFLFPFYFWGFFFETGFLCVALTVLEFTP